MVGQKQRRPRLKSSSDNQSVTGLHRKTMVVLNQKELMCAGAKVKSFVVGMLLRLRKKMQCLWEKFKLGGEGSVGTKISRKWKFVS